ncbi:MAG: hypothetical protein FJZ67_10790 [Bacteroidetes bacterium]|nr:hypothetical protein [Bacteroidota bacterium]
MGENFYIREIKTFTKISINPSMKMIAKRDTLYYYWNLKDYDAECLYFGSKELIHEIIEVLKNNKDFKKVKSLKMPTIKGIEDELNIKEIHLIFRKEIKGKERIYMAFDSTNTKVYYSAVHYE